MRNITLYSVDWFCHRVKTDVACKRPWYVVLILLQNLKTVLNYFETFLMTVLLKWYRNIQRNEREGRRKQENPNKYKQAVEKFRHKPCLQPVKGPVKSPVKLVNDDTLSVSMNAYRRYHLFWVNAP